MAANACVSRQDVRIASEWPISAPNTVSRKPRTDVSNQDVIYQHSRINYAFDMVAPGGVNGPTALLMLAKQMKEESKRLEETVQALWPADEPMANVDFELPNEDPMYTDILNILLTM
ncbi:unnamed protein product [Aphanomyces euteiches]